MKKIISLGLTALLCFTCGSSAFANNDLVINSSDDSEKYIINKYDALFEKNRGNIEATLDELVSSSDSLEIVEYKETFRTIDGQSVHKSSPADVRFTDSIIHDSDWNTYVYIGTWDWINSPGTGSLRPFDVVEVYSQSSYNIAPKHFIVYGYDDNGNRVAYYNSDTEIANGNIQKGIESSTGAAFWVDESEIDNGRMTVPLDYKTGSNTKIMMEYNHSYSETNVDSFGGNISRDGVGFSISWISDVYGWGPITSFGARIPG